MTDSMIHTPVLLEDILNAFDPKPGETFVDATVNGGGHAKEIYGRVQPGGKVLGIDWDCGLVARLAEQTKQLDNFQVVCDTYANIIHTVRGQKFSDIRGILIDAGFSSYHVDASGRGFTFTKDEPLDMRYHSGEDGKPQESQITAATIVNTESEKTLEKIFKEYGEERFARQIAHGIVASRKRTPIRTTAELCTIIRQAIPRAGRGIHYATRTFQALRIAVNRELENLEQGLVGGLEVLSPGGRLAVISFHSLEDRIVKNFFRESEKNGTLRIVTKKPIVGGVQEIRMNPRARSAKLRIAEKISIP